ANVVRSSPCVGAFVETKPNISNGQRIRRQINQARTSSILLNVAMRKSLPVGWQSLRKIFRTYELAVSNGKPGCKRLSPRDPDGVDLFCRAEVDDYPLRATRIVLTGEMSIEIGITLPKRSFVTVVDAGVAVIVCLVDCVAPVRQVITVREFYWLR